MKITFELIKKKSKKKELQTMSFKFSINILIYKITIGEYCIEAQQNCDTL